MQASAVGHGPKCASMGAELDALDPRNMHLGRVRVSRAYLHARRRFVRRIHSLCQLRFHCPSPGFLLCPCHAHMRIVPP